MEVMLHRRFTTLLCLAGVAGFSATAQPLPFGQPGDEPLLGDPAGL